MARRMRRFILLMAMVLVVLIPCAVSEDAHCQNGGSIAESILTQSETSDTHEIRSYKRDESHLRQPRDCWWKMPITSTGVALMEMRHPKRAIVPGDSMPYMTVFLTRNGRNVTEFLWNATNMTFIATRRGDNLYIRLHVDNITAVRMDNLLYLSLSVISENATCRDDGQFFCDNGDVYTVRPASFVCGAQLNNCSFAAQFSSVSDLQRFTRRAANSTGAVGKELLRNNKSGVLIGNTFHDGALMYQNSQCLISGDQDSLQWDTTNSQGPYVAANVSTDGRVSLSRLSHAAAIRLEAVLLRVVASSNTQNASADCPPSEGDGGAGGESNAPNMAAVIVVPIVVIIVLAVLFGIVVYLRIRQRQRASSSLSNNGASNGANGHQQDSLLNARGASNSAAEQPANGLSSETHAV